MLEMTFSYAYYAEYNQTGVPCNDPFIFSHIVFFGSDFIRVSPSKSANALLAIAVILNSGRNSASFVCLLVVCMGYGLVKPTLGSTAYKVLGLGFIHFIFGTLFAASTMLQTAATQKIMALLFVFPLALTLTIFYSWTFNSLTVTIKKLELRRQSAKTKVYRRLWRLLMFSLLILFIFVILAIVQRYGSKFLPSSHSLFFLTHLLLSPSR